MFYDSNGIFISFNRTFMELKLRPQRATQLAEEVLIVPLWN